MTYHVRQVEIKWKTFFACPSRKLQTLMLRIIMHYAITMAQSYAPIDNFVKLKYFWLSHIDRLVIKNTSLNEFIMMRLNVWIWVICCRFEWTVDRNEIPKRSLEVFVKNDVSFFSRSKTTMGKVSSYYCPTRVEIAKMNNLFLVDTDKRWKLGCATPSINKLHINCSLQLIISSNVISITLWTTALMMGLLDNDSLMLFLLVSNGLVCLPIRFIL